MVISSKITSAVAATWRLALTARGNSSSLGIPLSKHPYEHADTTRTSVQAADEVGRRHPRSATLLGPADVVCCCHWELETLRCLLPRRRPDRHRRGNAPRSPTRPVPGPAAPGGARAARRGGAPPSGGRRR